MIQTSVLKFYKDLEKYAVIKDSQFILNIPLVLMSELFEQAKEMEKQQIIDANYDGQRLHSKSCTKQMLQDNAESYFADTYGSKGSDETNGNNVEKVPNVTSSQTEISDGEIQSTAETFWTEPNESDMKRGWKLGAKWYREQLKSRQ